MARNVRTSRRPLLDEPAPIFNPGLGIARGRVRRSGAVRRVPNVFMQQVYYYGFLTSLEGDEKGPWLLDFECTDALWFNDVVENQMPGNYRLPRLEQIIGDRDYWTAWENSVAQRVVLRHFYEHYRDIAGSTDNPAPLATYHIQLDSSGVSTQIERPPQGQHGNIQEGFWYGLTLGRYRNQQVLATPETGMLSIADPQTDELGDPQAYKLISLSHLAAKPPPPVQGFFQFRGMFRSQPVLQALHFTRGI